MTEPVLILCPAELIPSGGVWGSDESGPAADGNAALDWLTLCRLLGWGVEVRAAEHVPARELVGRSVVIQTPNGRRPPPLDAIHPLLVIHRASGAAVAGRSLAWTGPGAPRGWVLAEPLEAHELTVREGDEVWARLDGSPTIVARPRGRLVEAFIGFDPSAARRAAGGVSALLRTLLCLGAPAPAAWLDFRGTLVLRMDDPGASANVHLRPWSYAKLGEEQWSDIARALRLRGARMTIGYTPGWVDDGDSARGELLVAGYAVDRVPGAVHPSPLVRYLDRAGNAPGTLNDHEAEFSGIQLLRHCGLGDVELHGHTHVYPDAASWASASDRYVEVSWYRELGSEAASAVAARPATQHPLSLGVASLWRHFGVAPTTLVCPGHAWTPAILERALALDFDLVASTGVALRDGNRFCWCLGVATRDLDSPAAACFDAELPVVGHFHDREPALFGTDWVTDWIDRWRVAGARRLIDFRELAAALALRMRLEPFEGAWQLRVGRRRPVALPRPLEVMLRFPGRPPRELETVRSGSVMRLPVQTLEHGLARIVLPADPGVAQSGVAAERNQPRGDERKQQEYVQHDGARERA